METTEFSLDGFTDYCKLKWSKPRLAKNLNWYRKAEPTEIFWNWYNGDQPGDKTKRKKFLKEHQIGVYKEYGQFGLFDWNFPNKGTETEYEQQLKDKGKELMPVLYESLLAQIQKGTAKEYELDKRELDRCKDYEDMKDFAIYKVVCGLQICDNLEYKYSLK